MGNWWDFFKPELSSEYPSVDGPLTLHSYLGGLEQSYENFVAKETKRIKGSTAAAKTNGVSTSTSTTPAAAATNGHAEGPAVSLKDFDYIGFHGPYGKMVQKGTARLVSVGEKACVRLGEGREFAARPRSASARKPLD